MDTNQTTVAPTASTTPAPAAAVADRPTSFSQAFEQASAAETAAPADPVESTTPADNASVDATVPPAADAPTDHVPPVEAQGPIPFQRHKQALDNARKEAAADAEKAFAEKHRNHLEWAQAVEANPVNALHLVKDALRDPEYGPAMRAELARMFGGLRQAPKETVAAEAEPEPDLDVTDGQGRVIDKTYSAPQLKKLREWERRQAKADFDKQIAPLVQDHQTRQQNEKAVQMWKASESEMKAVFDDYAEMPGFKTSDGKVHPDIIKHFKELTALDGRGFPKTKPERALLIAYQRVLKGNVMPDAEKKSQQDLMAQAAAKAAGRTDNPAAATPAPPRRPRSWQEAFEQQGLQ